jgi:hypothetical protein
MFAVFSLSSVGPCVCPLLQSVSRALLQDDHLFLQKQQLRLRLDETALLRTEKEFTKLQMERGRIGEYKYI